MKKILQHYQIIIEEKIHRALSELGPPGVLREACSYALTSPGKRLRPALVLIVADAVNKGTDVSDAALAIEFFHTSSLIVDDLPCMDDDNERRNRPSLHRVYGEATALLASYALIAAGYRCLASNAASMRTAALSSAVDIGMICQLALENVSFNMGLYGATGGQQIDLFPPHITLDIVHDVIQKKTISLFEVAFVLGWLYGGGELNGLDRVKKAAHHLGLAFQVADDIADLEQDAQNGCKINMAALIGESQARALVERELIAYSSCLKELNIATTSLAAIARAISK